jgi:stage II sporulation protein AB (anti-sigma F factor)
VESVPAARHALTEFAREHGADPEAVAIAVSEAVGNAIIHGYRGHASGPVTIEASLEPETMLVVVEDEGVGMSPNPNTPGLGLGLPLMGRFTRSVDIERNPPGTRLLMRFARR